MAKIESVTGIFVDETGELTDNPDVNSTHVGNMVLSEFGVDGDGAFVANLDFVIEEEFEDMFDDAFPDEELDNGSS